MGTKRAKPAKISARRTIKTMGIASLLRTAPRNGSVGGIDRSHTPYWRNAGQEG